MTRNSVLLNEHEKNIQWNGFASPSIGGDLGPGKLTLPQFTIFPVSDKGEKSSKVFEPFSEKSTSPEYQGRAELAYGPSQIGATYANIDPCYGLFSPFGSQFTGRIMLPLDVTADEGPIYVNAKQYNGIIRRRISRAKAEAVNKALKIRKPYLHQSRHLHAMRRPRGSGGRFLNTKISSSGNTKNETKKAQSGNFTLSVYSQNSEIIQSDSRNLSSRSLNEKNIKKKANNLGAEVNNIFSTPNLDLFTSNFGSLSNPITGHGLAMASNWI